MSPTEHLARMNAHLDTVKVVPLEFARRVRTLRLARESMLKNIPGAHPLLAIDWSGRARACEELLHELFGGAAPTFATTASRTVIETHKQKLLEQMEARH